VTTLFRPRLMAAFVACVALALAVLAPGAAGAADQARSLGPVIGPITAFKKHCAQLVMSGRERRKSLHSFTKVSLRSRQILCLI